MFEPNVNAELGAVGTFVVEAVVFEAMAPKILFVAGGWPKMNGVAVEPVVVAGNLVETLLQISSVFDRFFAFVTCSSSGDFIALLPNIDFGTSVGPFSAAFTRTLSKIVMPLLAELEVGPVSVTSFDTCDPNMNGDRTGAADGKFCSAGFVAGALKLPPNKFVVVGTLGVAVVDVVPPAGLPNWNVGLLSGCEPKLKVLLDAPKENFGAEEKPKSFFAVSFATPGFGVAQQVHFSFSFAFWAMHDVHSHVAVFCFSAIDLNVLSHSTGAFGVDAVAGAGATAAAEVGAVSGLTAEGKMAGFPNVNGAELNGFCDGSLALSSFSFSELEKKI